MAVLSKVANIAVQPQPVGVVEAFAGSNAPNGWLICDGSQVSRSLFPELFSVIGTTYGSGDGFATFTLPDLRGRTIAGRDGVNNMNNGPTNRLTSSHFGASGTALGNSGGNEAHTLNTNQMPSHTHAQDAHSHSVESPAGHSWGANFGGLSGGATFTFSPSGVFAGVYGGQNLTAMGVTATNQNTGGNGAHNNTQPTMILNYIIKAVSELPRGGWYNSSSPDLVTSLPTNPYNGQEVYHLVDGLFISKRYDSSSSTWKTIAGVPTTGGVIQVQQSVKTDAGLVTGSLWGDVSGLSVNITPRSVTSKILVLADVKVSGIESYTTARARLVRGGSPIYVGDAASNRPRAMGQEYGGNAGSDGSKFVIAQVGGNYLDSPSTTSAVNYKIQVGGDFSGYAIYVNRTANDRDAAGYDSRVVSSITAMEIAG